MNVTEFIKNSYSNHGLCKDCNCHWDVIEECLIHSRQCIECCGCIKCDFCEQMVESEGFCAHDEETCISCRKDGDNPCPQCEQDDMECRKYHEQF